MSKFWVSVGVVATAAALAIPAGARVQAASGDICTASGSGTQYTLRISIPDGGQQQYGFALHAAGGTITNIVIPGANGNFSTAVSSLAPDTGAGWFGDAALPASSVVTVTTSGALKSVTIVPSVNASTANGGTTPATGQTQSTTATPSFLDPVVCSMTAAVPVSTTTFTIASHAVYSSKARGWHLSVTVPGAGTVSAVQLVPTAGGAYTKSQTAKPLVQAHRVAAKGSGSVMLTLKPTSTGQAALETNGHFKVPLRVTFDASTGKSAHKSVTLTLRA